MATLRIVAQNRTERVEEFDLGEASQHGYAGETDGGNLYLYVDGKEFGSIWVHVNDDGVPTITLGQYDDAEQQWVVRNDITEIPEV